MVVAAGEASMPVVVFTVEVEEATAVVAGIAEPFPFPCLARGKRKPLPSPLSLLERGTEKVQR